MKKEINKTKVGKKTKKMKVEQATKDQDLANEKLFEEIRGFKDNLSKLANQFDKELLERDKALKQY